MVSFVARWQCRMPDIQREMPGPKLQLGPNGTWPAERCGASCLGGFAVAWQRWWIELVRSKPSHGRNLVVFFSNNAIKPSPSTIFMGGVDQKYGVVYGIVLTTKISYDRMLKSSTGWEELDQKWRVFAPKIRKFLWVHWHPTWVMSRAVKFWGCL